MNVAAWKGIKFKYFVLDIMLRPKKLSKSIVYRTLQGAESTLILNFFSRNYSLNFLLTLC